MTTDQLKNIFGRFQNLNLLFLIEDLRRGLVARGVWCRSYSGAMCPLAHGWDRWHNQKYKPWECLGLSESFAKQFTTAWDSQLVQDIDLLDCLKALYAERLADADVVQAVCLPIGEPVDVPQAQAVAQ